MSRNVLRVSFAALSTLLVANAFAAIHPYHAFSATTLSQPANDGNDPGGGGQPNPPCNDGQCIARAL